MATANGVEDTTLQRAKKLPLILPLTGEPNRNGRAKNLIRCADSRQNTATTTAVERCHEPGRVFCRRCPPPYCSTKESDSLQIPRDLYLSVHHAVAFGEWPPHHTRCLSTMSQAARITCSRCEPRRTFARTPSAR